jgi:hypothetical protein
VLPFTGLDGSLQCSPQPATITLVSLDVSHTENSQSETQNGTIDKVITCQIPAFIKPSKVLFKKNENVAVHLLFHIILLSLTNSIHRKDVNVISSDTQSLER